MPYNSSASVFGGAGGRGVRASVSSLEGLRKVLRNPPDTERDSAPIAPAAAPLTASEPSAAPAVSIPDDNKQELQTLNNRLKNYLDKVKQLEEENNKLQGEIDDILAKRKAPDGRNWAQIQKPLEDLEQEIKELTLENARLLLQIDNSKLAFDDFKNKLNDETRLKKELEKDLELLKKDIEDTKQSRDQLKKETELAKDEVDHLEKDHKDEVKILRDKIKNAEVKVEIESQNSNLGEIVNNMRVQYQKLAEKNLKETEEWYNTKFENIQMKETQNTEALDSGKMELKELMKKKKTLEMEIQASYNTIRTLEDNLLRAKAENNHRLAPLNSVILSLEAELKEVRAQVEQRVESYKELLCLKMKLEKEIQDYNKLILSITADPESMEFNIKDALTADQQRPDRDVEEVIVD